jgi:hypothetical protein
MTDRHTALHLLGVNDPRFAIYAGRGCGFRVPRGFVLMFGTVYGPHQAASMTNGDDENMFLVQSGSSKQYTGHPYGKVEVDDDDTYVTVLPQPARVRVASPHLPLVVVEFVFRVSDGSEVRLTAQRLTG